MVITVMYQFFWFNQFSFCLATFWSTFSIILLVHFSIGLSVTTRRLPNTAGPLTVQFT